VRAFWLLLGSVALGLGLAIVWSPSFVDQTIGENGATTILGYSVTARPITGVLMAIGFAFVSGLTGTFTACNVAGLSAMAPSQPGGNCRQCRPCDHPDGWRLEPAWWPVSMERSGRSWGRASRSSPSLWLAGSQSD
jgi:hypothetical protein